MKSIRVFLDTLAPAALGLVMLAGGANGQNISSDKAFFTSNTTGVTLVPVGSSGTSAEVPILTGQIKTSSVGSILAGVSMECAVWTNTITTATSGGGKNTSTASASVRANVYIDGVLATPSPVTFCSRLQSVGLSVISSCTLSGTTGTCTVSDTITLDLFQATKDANHYNFYAPNPQSTAAVHDVVVKAIGQASCTSTSGGVTTTIPCPASDGQGTLAAIGKATLVIENFNNAN